MIAYIESVGRNQPVSYTKEYDVLRES